MSDNTKPVKSVLVFLLIAVALAVTGAIVAVLAVLIVRVAVGNDSLAVIGLGIIGAIIGYMVGIIAGLTLLRKFSPMKGSVLLGSIGVLVWAVAGYLVAMLFNEIAVNPWVALIFFYGTLSFVGFGAYSLKRRR